jgi:hypothetical protein
MKAPIILKPAFLTELERTAEVSALRALARMLRRLATETAHLA